MDAVPADNLVFTFSYGLPAGLNHPFDAAMIFRSKSTKDACICRPNDRPLPSRRIFQGPLCLGCAGSTPRPCKKHQNSFGGEFQSGPTSCWPISESLESLTRKRGRSSLKAPLQPLIASTPCAMCFCTRSAHLWACVHPEGPVRYQPRPVL